jgi:hypothetical protein
MCSIGHCLIVREYITVGVATIMLVSVLQLAAF